MSKKILTTITIIWMIIIFIFSNQPASTSSDRSNSLIKNTIVRIYKLFNPNPTNEEIDNIIKKYDYPVRKTAHFIEYFILGILIRILLSKISMLNLI